VVLPGGTILNEADQKVWVSLQERIEEQRLELERKNNKLGALQRNFENMCSVPDNSVEQADLQRRFQQVARELADVTRVAHEKSALVDELRQQLAEAGQTQGAAEGLNRTNAQLQTKIHELESNLKKTLAISKTRMSKLQEASKATQAMQAHADECSSHASQAVDRAKEAERLVAVAQAEAATNEKEMWAQQAKASHALQEAQRLEAFVAELSKAKMQHQMRLMELEGEVEAATRAREALSRSGAEERRALHLEAEGLRDELEREKRSNTQLSNEVERLRNSSSETSQADRIALQLAQQDVLRLEGELEESEAGRLRLDGEIRELKAGHAAGARGSEVLREELEALRARELAWLAEKERLGRLHTEGHQEVLKLKEEINSLEREGLEGSEALRRECGEKEECKERLSETEKDMKEKQTLSHETLRALQEKYDQLVDAGSGLDKKKLKDALAKMSNAQEAMEGVLTCMNCMDVYQTPMTYIPCGHTFCKECVESSKARNGGDYCCDECGTSKPVKSVTPNALIDEVAGKFTYQKQVLAALQKL